MQIHAALRWPDASDRELWPMAIVHAVALHNMTPKMATGYSPEELWTGSRSSHLKLQNVHVWGCPLYILDPHGQAGHKLPAWDPRARHAQNMGFSPLHASTVVLARNLSTGHISPQFHIVYDDYFKTVHSNGDDPPDEWNELVTVQSLRSNIDEDDPDHLPELADEWLNPAELADRRRRLIDKKISTAETKTQDKPTRYGTLQDPPRLPPESKTTQATYPIPEEEAFFDASSRKHQMLFRRKCHQVAFREIIPPLRLSHPPTLMNQDSVVLSVAPTCVAMGIWWIF
jgi:hypothetical protein